MTEEKKLYGCTQCSRITYGPCERCSSCEEKISHLYDKDEWYVSRMLRSLDRDAILQKYRKLKTG